TGREIHLANRFRGFEAAQQGFRRRRSARFAGLPAPGTALGVDQVSEMRLVEGVEQSAVTEHATEILEWHVLLAVGIERITRTDPILAVVQHLRVIGADEVFGQLVNTGAIDRGRDRSDQRANAGWQGLGFLTEGLHRGGILFRALFSALLA